jgi:hypothetical protein
MDKRVEIGMAAYQSATRYFRFGDETVGMMYIIPLALDIRTRFPQGGPPPSKEQVMEFLDKHVLDEREKVGMNLAAYYITLDLAHHHRDQSAVG